MVTVTHAGGNLVTNISAVLIFVRTDPTDWVDQFAVPNTPTPVAVVCEITSFVRDLVDSAYMDAISKAYSLPGVKIGRGTFGGTFYLDVVPATAYYKAGPSGVLDDDIQQAIVNAVALGKLPIPNSNTVYIVIAPGEVRWKKGLTGTKAGGGGYHDKVQLTQTSAAGRDLSLDGKVSCSV